MDEEKLLALVGRLKLPEAVLEPLTAAAKALPEDLPIEQLTEPGRAAAAWEAIAVQLPARQEDNGMAQLAVALAAACRTEERYRWAGIPANVFLSTMDCFRWFLEETHACTGQWAFDRGFWTWRQTGMLLFRLGTLEFECWRIRSGPRPEGLEVGDPVLSVHIPSDAVLRREELDCSYNMAQRFFSQGRLCPFGRPKAIMCESWLLAPVLNELLPPNSGIRRFAGDYRLYDIDKEDQEFYQWIFGGYKPLEELPGRTSLQRAVTQHLTAGGHVGMAKGSLDRKINFNKENSAL